MCVWACVVGVNVHAQTGGRERVHVGWGDAPVARGQASRIVPVVAQVHVRLERAISRASATEAPHSLQV